MIHKIHQQLDLWSGFSLPTTIDDLPFLSFFSGAGFLDLGFETTGFQPVIINEFSDTFMEAYKHSREQMKLRHSVRSGLYVRDSIENIDHTVVRELCVALRDSFGLPVGFVGGPPCPDFSIAGKQRGGEGENGKLSRKYAELIVAARPDWFLFENVKGLYRTKKHRAFFDQLKALLRKAGYSLTEKLINAVEYGAPQDRERIILLGFHKDTVGSSHSVQLYDHSWASNMLYDSKRVFALPWPKTDPFGSRPRFPPDCIRELTVQYWFDRNDVDSHPNADHHFKPRAGLPKFQSISEGDDSRKSTKRLHRWRYSPTVAYGNNEVHLHPYKPRRISAAEALALQSMPAEYSLPPTMTLSAMFKTIGNGVPYLAAVGLAKTVRNLLDA